MPVNLTANAIPAILAGDLNLKPLVQLLDIKPIGSSQERYRLFLSDSVSTHQAMLATQLNDRVKTGDVRDGSVVQLIEYMCSTVQNRKIIVVLNMNTIMAKCEIIGKPIIHTESNFISQNPPPNSISNNRPNPTTTQTFRPTIQPPYQPPPPIYKPHGSITKNEAPPRIIPITALNPYQGRWAIKARVTAKGDLRRYNNAKGDGKVFSFDLLDSDSGEIRVTCFNSVVDRFYDSVHVGKVYVISKGSLKPAKRNFNHLNNEWEIFLESSSTIDLCNDEDSTIPQQQFSYKKITEIESLESNSIIDIIGIVTAVNPSVPILRKNGMETQRRILTITDQSTKSVEITLWGDFCNREGQTLHDLVNSGSQPVLTVKAGKVNDFTGKTIGTVSSTQLFINPDSQEAKTLKTWFNTRGKTVISQSISISRDGFLKTETRKTVAQIKDEGLGRSEKADWVTIKGTIIFIKTDSFCYTACPLMIGDRKCSKKVVKDNNDNKWKCERCNEEFEECDYRYLLQCQVQDHTGLTWVTAFQESGEEIMGCDAKELYVMKYEENDEEGFGRLVKSRLFKEVVLKLKVKEEVYGEEQRVKVTVVKVDEVDYGSNTKVLLHLIGTRSAARSNLLIG